MTFDIGLHEVCVRVGVRYVITKFSRMDSLPDFVTHGAPLHALRPRELHYYYSNEEWSSQLWTQFMQLRNKKKKFQGVNGVWTGDLAIPVQCSNLCCAMRPLMLGAGQLLVIYLFIFSGFLHNCIIKIVFTTARIILHLISFPQF